MEANRIAVRWANGPAKQTPDNVKNNRDAGTSTDHGSIRAHLVTSFFKAKL